MLSSRYAEATEAAMALIAGGSTLATSVNLPMIPEKTLWDTQIVGTYDLIFPHMHFDYPTRDEVYAYVQASFDIHDISNYHNGKDSQPGSTIVETTPYIPMEVTVEGLTEISVVRGASPINDIGYGL